MLLRKSRINQFMRCSKKSDNNNYYLLKFSFKSNWNYEGNNSYCETFIKGLFSINIDAINNNYNTK